MQYYLAVFGIPINVGGKPLNSWPAFIPITFELTILCASFAAVFGCALNKLPQPYHPVFNAPNFDLADRADHFYLVIEANDPKYNHDEVMRFMQGLDAKQVMECGNLLTTGNKRQQPIRRRRQT